MRKKLLVLGMVFTMLLPMTVSANAACQHEVGCYDRTVCIKCEKKIGAGDSFTVVHPMVGCNDKTVCLECNEKVKTGERYDDVSHVTEEELGGTCVKISETEHKVTCACGQDIYTEMHTIVCTSTDNKCHFCHEVVAVDIIDAYWSVHEGEELKTDANYHWRECPGCHELTMPKLEHYTSCVDKYAGKTACSFCGREDAIIAEDDQGIHESFSRLSKDKKGNLVHEWYCIACNSVVKDKKDEKAHLAKPKYKNLKDGYHSIICSCGYAFDDEQHSWSKYKVTQKATTKKAGSKVHYCKYCKAKATTKVNKIKSVKLSKTTYKYNGKKRLPKVVVIDSKGKTISSSNYTVKYSKGCKKAGKYKVIIKMKGAYSGTFVKTFTIKK